MKEAIIITGNGVNADEIRGMEKAYLQREGKTKG